MSVGRWWNYTDSGKSNTIDSKLFKWHFVLHKYYWNRYLNSAARTWITARPNLKVKNCWENTQLLSEQDDVFRFYTCRNVWTAAFKKLYKADVYWVSKNIRGITYCWRFHVTDIVKLHGYTVHQQYWTLFYYQLMNTTLKNAELLKHSKLDKNAPTCFGLHRNNLQGAKVSAWLKITHWLTVSA